MATAGAISLAFVASGFPVTAQIALPNGPNRELVQRTCGACHDLGEHAKHFKNTKNSQHSWLTKWPHQKCHPIIAINVTSNKLIILIGSKYFHSRFSNWSMRNRGKVHRNHMMMKMRKNVLPKNHTDDGMKSIIWLKSCQLPIWSGIHPPRNRVAPMAHTINILTYSAKKNRANFIPEYSV